VSSPRYRDLIRRHGRLLVAELDGEVVGFGGMVEIAHPDGPVAMITDLFVDERRHGHGAGRAIAEALVEGHERRMTFSSRHPAARGLYASLGLEPRWTLRYLRGVARPTESSLVAWAVDPWSVATDRREYLHLLDPIECFEVLDGPDVIGHAITQDDGSTVAVHRLVTSGDHVAAIRALLNVLPAGRTVECCVPDVDPAAGALVGVGFAEFEHDLFMATAPDLMPAGAIVLNPGLA
jgi:hypothetical protein